MNFEYLTLFNEITKIKNVSEIVMSVAKKLLTTIFSCIAIGAIESCFDGKVVFHHVTVLPDHLSFNHYWYI